jgi:hypothetical protein
MYTIIVHISNAEPIKVEVDELPKQTDTCVIGKNPRLRSEKEVEWVDEGVNIVIFPWHRISFIQVIPSGEEESDFVGLFRD